MVKKHAKQMNVTKLRQMYERTGRDGIGFNSWARAKLVEAIDHLEKLL